MPCHFTPEIRRAFFNAMQYVRVKTPDIFLDSYENFHSFQALIGRYRHLSPLLLGKLLTPLRHAQAKSLYRVAKVTYEFIINLLQVKYQRLL